MSKFLIVPGAVQITLSKPGIWIHLRQGDYDKASAVITNAAGLSYNRTTKDFDLTSRDIGSVLHLTAEELCILLGDLAF